MYNEKHIVIRSLPLYTLMLLNEQAKKIRRFTRTHKDAVITCAVLGTTAAVVGVSMKSLSDKVNA